MTLRRTALARRTELRRTPMKRTSSRARTAGGPRRSAYTGPSAAEKHLVAVRAGWSCEICGRSLHVGDTWSAEHSFHHRRPRGMGGTTRADVHAAYNLLLLCGSGTSESSGCHGYLESHRAFALTSGWLVAQAQDPATVPVLIRGHSFTLLTADGGHLDPHGSE